MLVLTRRVGEKLRIGDNVYVYALGVDGNQMKLGIDAPKDVEIVRGELDEREATEGKTFPPGNKPGG